MTGIDVRGERPDDAEAIRTVTREAFAGAPHADGSEPVIPERLRESGALTLSLVAEAGGDVVGHVAASPVAIASDGPPRDGWFGIGPLSVRPDMQRRGVGTALMGACLAEMREAGAAGCVLIGDPGYYGRFGFASNAALDYAGVPSAYVLALPFGDDRPEGTLHFDPAFGGA